MVRTNYIGVKEDIKDMIPKSSASNTWRGITHAISWVQKGVKFEANNGRSIRFWEDRWVEDKPLKDVAQNTNISWNTNARVVDMWHKDNRWNWETIQMILSEEMIAKMQLISLTEEEDSKDEASWTLESTGKYSVSSQLIKGDYVCM